MAGLRDAVRGLMLSPMGVIEFELERTISLATPILRRIAVKERTTTVDALKTSFETTG